jgi:hypothetical protein
LVVPADAGGLYRHEERHPGDVHEDWLERLICRSGYRWAAGDFDSWRDRSCEKTVRNAADRTPSGQPIRFARNYVVFAAGAPETVILAEPPLVAVHESGMGIAEKWFDDPLAVQLKALVLDMAKNPARGLRSSTTGFQHAPMPLTIAAQEWREKMTVLVKRRRLAVVA